MDDLWKLVLAFAGLFVLFFGLVMAGASVSLLQSAIFWITFSALGATFLGTASLACFEVAKYYRQLNASREEDEGAPALHAEGLYAEALHAEALRALVREVVAEEEAAQEDVRQATGETKRISDTANGDAE